MSDIAISVEKISKRYRIGLKEEIKDTFAGVIADIIKRPLNNFKKLRNLSRFKDNEAEKEDIIWALKDISFEVKQGEVIGIIGRNGAGKSTLLKILSRITEPSSGCIPINGRVASLLEVGTGFHPELTGRENIYLNGTILGMTKVEIDHKFNEILSFSGVEKFIDTPVKRYSSGMQVRLAFSVAAHLEPEILLVDEVLAVGDAEFQKKCLGKMTEVSKGGRTILFVSHNMSAIHALCKRTILIDNGKILQDGKTNEVISYYLKQKTLKKAIATTSEIEARIEGVINKKDPNIKFCEIAILDNKGIPRRAFFSDEEILVSVTFECLKTMIGLRITYFISNEKDDTLLVTQNTDDPGMITNFRKLNQGTYKTSCKFPANLFGSITLYASVHLELPKTEHLVAQHILNFEVKFKGYNNIHLDYKTYFRPQLKWKLEQATQKEN